MSNIVESTLLSVGLAMSTYTTPIEDPFIPDASEEFDESYVPTDWVASSTYSVADGVLTAAHNTSLYNSGQFYKLNTQLFMGDIDFRYRCKIGHIGYGCYVQLWLWRNGAGDEYTNIQLAGSGHGECIIFVTQAAGSGTGQVQILRRDNAYFSPDDWYTFRFLQNPDNTVSVMMQREDDPWVLLATTISLMGDAFDQYGAWFRINTWNHSLLAEPITVHFDYVRYTSRYSLWVGNWFGAMDVELSNHKFIASEGWETIIQYDWENNYDPLYLNDFDTPLPPYAVYVDYLVLSSSILPLKFWTKIRGDFHLDCVLDNITNPFPLPCDLGFLFYVDGIEILLGIVYDSGAKAAVRIGGVEYRHSLANFDLYDPFKLEFDLKDGALTVTAGHTALEDTEVLYSNPTFVTDPANVVTEDIAFVRDCTSTKGGYLLNLNILGQFKLPMDTLGDLEGLTLFPLVYLLASKLPPVILMPGFFFHRTAITGGGDALDGIDPTNIDETTATLKEGSTAWIITDPGNDMYLYRAYEQSGMVESFPDIIIPDNNPGNWYWQLVKCKMFQAAIITNYTDLGYTAQPWDYDRTDNVLLAKYFRSSDNYLEYAPETYILGDGTGVRTLFKEGLGTTSVLCIPKVTHRSIP